MNDENRLHRPRIGTTAVPLALLLMALWTSGCSGPPDQTDQRARAGGSGEATPTAQVRVALFNIRELNSPKLQNVDAEGTGADPQVRAAAGIVQQVRPDILVINEIDHDYATPEDLAANARRFNDSYLNRGDDPIDFPYAYAAPNNTGLLSGLDLNGDGHVATVDDRGTREHGEDCFGFGRHPGEFSMAILSRYPIRGADARTFQKFLWKDLPGHHMPEGYYSPAAVEVLRLSSKSHWDLPIEIGEHTLHLFVSHPTPQVFDAEEDRNGRRNFDEIKLWIDYLDGAEALWDDNGRRGGYESAEPFVIVGDLNAAPGTGSIYDGVASIAQLLDDERIQDTGHLLKSHRDTGGRPAGPPDFPERDTAVFGDGLRIDYLLPSAGLAALAGGVHWPSAETAPEQAALADTASDHRLVWIDLELKARTPEEKP